MPTCASAEQVSRAESPWLSVGVPPTGSTSSAWRPARRPFTWRRRSPTPRFAFPTALARRANRLLVTNSQLNATADPILPFTVLDLPVPYGWTA